MNSEIKENIILIVGKMPRYGKLIYRLYRDNSMSNRQRFILGAGLAYFLSPVDLIPGFIPVVGQLDDIIIALWSLVKVLQDIPSPKREVYLSGLDLTMREIERDLEVSQEALLYFTGKVAQYARRGVLFAGQKAVWLAGKGVLLVGSGVFTLYKKSRGKNN